MSRTSTRNKRAPEPEQAAPAVARADLTCPFGPSFFLGHLGRFVQDHCPDPKELLPAVQIRLADGTTLDLCHIIGVSPQWVMFAVRDTESHHEEMAIELVPFELIRGVSIRTRRAEGKMLGFKQAHTPEVIRAETLLQAVMPREHNEAG